MKQVLKGLVHLRARDLRKDLKVNLPSKKRHMKSHDITPLLGPLRIRLALWLKLQLRCRRRKKSRPVVLLPLLQGGIHALNRQQLLLNI